MREEIRKISDTLYDKMTEKLYEVLDIFNEYYGESNVDLQDIINKEDFYFYYGHFTVKNIFLKDNNNSSYIHQLSDDYIKEHYQELIDINNYNLSNLLYNIQDAFILVHFPTVVITNEFNESTEITHLYVKVYIRINGTIHGSFLLNRSEYSFNQFVSDYMHSHIARIPRYNYEEFQKPCLGTGPIRGTIENLNTKFDKDIWALFCFELDKYVHTESISGGPYHRLKYINYDGNFSRTGSEYIELNYYHHLRDSVNIIINFMSYVIDNCHDILKFSCSDDLIYLGMPLNEAILKLSNAFINWYNKFYYNKISIKYLEEYKIIFSGIIVGNKIFKINSNAYREINNEQDEGKYMCTFKGKDVKIHIIKRNINENNCLTLLDTQISYYILYSIIKNLNYNYGRTTENRDVPSITFL